MLAEPQKKGKRQWFIAVVNNRSEKKCSEVLQRDGYTVYVPVQKEKRIWQNGTKKTVDKVLIPSKVFVLCTEQERLEVVKNPYIKHFMVDYTRFGQYGNHLIATIPHHEIENFRRYIERTDEPVYLEALPYKVGDLVKITGGKFKGLEGNVVHYTEGKASLVIGLGILGCARMEVDIRDVLPPGSTGILPSCRSCIHSSHHR